MLEWTEQFATGHDTIDMQHRMLFNYINRLEGLLVITNPSVEECEFIIRLVGFMETYVDAHFRHEEQCMESYKCPVAAHNKDAHREFLAFFREFKERYSAEGFRPAVLAELHQSVDEWIRSHILQIDSQLRPCLKRP